MILASAGCVVRCRLCICLSQRGRVLSSTTLGSESYCSGQIVRIYENGASSVLKLEEAVPPALAEDEVLIKVSTIGLNRAEVLFRQGLYLERNTFPSRIGYEACGTVLACGSAVKSISPSLSPGDRVSTIPGFSQTKYGVYGQWAVVPARYVEKCSEVLSDEAGASIWMPYLTAYGAIKALGAVSAGQYVLITAASSSVGYAALEIVKREGAVSIATTRTAAKKQSLLDAGADHVIVTEEENLVAEVQKITNGKGADIIFDAVAGPLLLALAKSCAYEGQIFIYGALSLATTNFPLQLSLKRGLKISGYTMFQITHDDKRFSLGKEYVLTGIAEGTFKPRIDSVFDFNDIGLAQDYMESNKQNGKIVVKI